MNIEDLKSLMDAFDPASLLPEINGVLDAVVYAVRIATLLGPVVLLILGVGYLIFAPKEANYYFGYRCTFGMGSVEAWRFTQRLAGIVWSVLGLVLTGAMVLLTVLSLVLHGVSSLSKWIFINRQMSPSSSVYWPSRRKPAFS